MAGLRLQDLQMVLRWTVKAGDSHTAGSGNYHQIGLWKPSGFPSFYNFDPRNENCVDLNICILQD